ncbi:T-complex protein 11-like protein 1 isoform X2 [Toxorhynchites rutilus septentrionalis]|nr:T-complex protein 11-like protein 1 isoform X2 [Toxorhynchites rutilus septentrionalis]XP_055617621.1 T-complex protein 11-like protein 1 isoform X2 [Toxorhynchites rutilus septentrionalis]XP_055617622.1 T-complex protein 11-like protein 1 isoform X2 [Toxorhynchites rutilus septentrionalis]XP_055617623.1 T-complex protein 11-like protein 1 isoform X2 [Toxorhynchites rutilus septentrionalis]XP_055617624.1 T-complex protein 11-like protein 1 isoform X2 [Toxorhynchites rutilus septentrionalis]
MDSSESAAGSSSSEAKDIPASLEAALLRARTESESSDKSGPTRFVLPGTSGSPPKILTLEEVQDVVKNIENMTLAHEIAINSDFKLQPYEPPENSIERLIKDTMHKAYWDLLSEQLGRDPPCYDMAIQLLADVKDAFQSVLSKNNERALARINEILDETVIRQQAEKGTLDFQAYAKFVIHIMALSCAPVRDEQIAKLKEIDDVVELFRGILEALSVMKLDMANCLLDAARNDVIANSVEYEKQKFKQFLELYKDGFPETEKWLKRNQVPEIAADAVGSPNANGSDQQRRSKDAIFNAYLELIDWNSENDFPEMLEMDRDRLIGLQGRASRLCTCASTLAITCAAVPSIAQAADLRKKIAKELIILVQNCNNTKDLDDTIENIWLHVRSVIAGRLQELHQPQLLEPVESTLKNQILQIAKKESPVRNLMWKRLLAYTQLVLRTNNPIPVPPGFQEFGEEVESLATAFKRISFYNYAVYGEYYHEILNKV